MRVQLGDCEFYAEGTESFVNACFLKWLDAALKHWRRPIEKRISGLQAEPREQRRLLKIIDKTTEQVGGQR